MNINDISMRFAKDFAELLANQINKEPNSAYYYAFRHGAHDTIVRILNTLPPEDKKRIIAKVAEFYDGE